MTVKPTGELFIVDDDSATRDALSVVFTLAGYRIAGFAEGESFIATARMPAGAQAGAQARRLTRDHHRPVCPDCNLVGEMLGEGARGMLLGQGRLASIPLQPRSDVFAALCARTEAWVT